MSPSSPLRLSPSRHEKIWGSTDLAPLFPPSDRKIGEIWYGRCDLPLLVKFLFTSDKLSVQVHPAGKTEMWYVLRADPGAAIAAGLRATLTPDQLRQAALSGEIARYLNWIPVRAGDAILCQAGTVHTIGAGLALCEIQQNLDVTYRLFDFGRGRELHLDEAVRAARPDLRPAPLPAPSSDQAILAACDHFVVERLRVASVERCAAERRQWLIFLEGRGMLGGEPYQPGDVFLIEPGLAAVEWRPASPSMALRAAVP